MEILIIDSGSEQQECKIVEEFQKVHNSIIYFKTNERESLYKSWNRAIQKARGIYLTNANTDDRHHFECLERLVNTLEENPDDAVAYGNLYKSSISNETFEDNDKSMPCYSQKNSPGSLLLQDFIGAQPVWRKSLHDQIGMFDESFEVVGDYEFFLRAASDGCTFIHEPKAEGIMLWHQSALSTKDSKGVKEKKLLFEKYRKPKKIIEFYQRNISSDTCDPSIDSFLDLGIRSLCYFPQFDSNNPQFDFNLAKECFQQAPDDPTLKHNLSTLDKVFHVSDVNNENTHIFYGSQLELPTEYELKKIPATYLIKDGVEKINGKNRQKFIFNSRKFTRSLFSHLQIQNLSKYKQIFIYGFNERGKLLGKHLLSFGHNNIIFVDNFFGEINGGSKMTDFNIFSFDHLMPCLNACFILAMSSHHWKSVTTQILIKYPDSEIQKIDRS
jgi:glycosyltransferase involved in cell wall biosynthesis